MESDSLRKYQLMFKGPKDESPDTIRKIKSAFVVDLSFSIEETRQVIENSPCLVLNTDDLEEIERFRHVLNQAGAETESSSQESGGQIEEDEDPNIARILEENDEPIWEQKTESVPDALEDEDFEDADETSFEMELDLSSAVGDPGDSPQKVYDITAEPPAENSGKSAAATSVSSSPTRPSATRGEGEKETELPRLDATEESEPFFSFDDISKALEESQAADTEDGALLESAVRESDKEEVDLSFSFESDAPIIPAAELEKAKESAEKRSAGGKNEDLEFPEIVMDGEEVAHPTAQPEASPPTAEPSPEQPATEAPIGPPKLAAIAVSPRTPPPGFPAIPEPEISGEMPPSPAPKRAFVKEILLPVVILGTLLGAGNWYYFSTRPAPQAPAQPSKAVARSTAAPERPSPAPAKTGPVTYSGEKVDDKATTKASFVVEENVIKSFSIEITTPRPPELTPDQIVRRERKKPWLSKISFDNVSITPESDVDFTAKGPAKAYIEDNKVNFRVIGTATMKGAFNNERTSIKLSVTASYNTSGNALPDGSIIERAQEGNVAFEVASELELKKNA